jgi:hypothetical protein
MPTEAQLKYWKSLKGKIPQNIKNGSLANFNRGRRRPDVSARMKGKKYSLGRPSWCKGTKGMVKANSGSFVKGKMSGKNHPQWKGGRPKCEVCNKTLWYGYKRCHKHIIFKDPIGRKKRISESHRGEKAYNWKGGLKDTNKRIRASADYANWRNEIFEHDNWTCQKCKIRGGNLVAHHLYNFSEHHNLRMSIYNGITLCKRCHLEFHNKYGRKMNTKEDIKEFINEKDNYKIIS